MDNLPPEVLHKIFILLDLQQRLTCLTVCRNWWNVLDSCSLFYSVRIEAYNDRLHEIMNTFERLPDRAAQVKELEYVIKIDTKFNRRKIVNIFPKARVIKVKRRKLAIYPDFSNNNQLIEQTYSNSRVESLSEARNFDLLSQMLSFKLLGRLKVLDLDFNAIPDIPDILSQLKDLPVLKKLTLKETKINLDILEEIHGSIPSIEDFTLKSVTIEPGSIPSNIVPATFITKLDIDTKWIFDITARTRTEFYQYMAKKYVNITQIKYQDTPVDLYGFYTADNRKQMYLHGVIDFLKIIGPIKNEFTFPALPDGVNPFETLDSVNTRIKTLEFNMCDSKQVVQYLYQSKQYNYIETLNFNRTIPYDIYLLKEMPVLTSLEISIYKLPKIQLNLVDCLVGCPPSLKSLAITAKNLAVEAFTTKLDSVEKLEICCEILTKELGNIISNCFPNLTELKLVGEMVQDVNIMLKSPRFQIARFSPSTVDIPKRRKFGFMFKSPNQTEIQCYRWKHGWKMRVRYDSLAFLHTLSVETLTDAKLETDFYMKVVSLNTPLLH